MYSTVQPHDWVCMRMPSDSLRVLQVSPNTTISLARYGSFPANLILGRPYNLTYEILDKQQNESFSRLRIVSASELHADAIAEEAAATAEGNALGSVDGVQLEVVGDDGDVIMRSNRNIIDDASRQTLSMEEIGELKRNSTDAGKDLIAKLMASHTAIDQKTAFSLAKYKLLKTKKYLRQFTLLPLDVAMLTQWLVEDKDPGRIMEMREEMLALVGCWGNVHYSGPAKPDVEPTGGRWLVVDDVGGLLVAATAERMGVLFPEPKDPSKLEEKANGSHSHPDESEPFSQSSNTITLVHTNAQPNLSLLKYFNYIADTPPPSHPLTPALRSLSWLQLLNPAQDTAYNTCPPTPTPDELKSWKSSKRGNYYRKRRRYLRTRSIVDETRAGGFNGLLVASSMDPQGILQACVPLLSGGAPVVIYSPTIEPLTQLADLYSVSRRTAFINAPPEDEEDLVHWKGSEDFPLNPTLLLGVAVQTSKVRDWQVLPGRTHPKMTSRGGAEGYVFTAVRVIPAEGKVEARGKYKRKRVKVNGTDGGGVTSISQQGDDTSMDDRTTIVDQPVAETLAV